ncbi:6637_t:CDS:1, partial [Gigaspora rosea]
EHGVVCPNGTEFEFCHRPGDEKVQEETKRARSRKDTAMYPVGCNKENK